MSRYDQILVEDYEYIYECQYLPWEELNNQTILVTGATGLIGSTLIKALIYANRNKGFNINLFIVLRDINRARQILGNEIIDSEYVTVQIGDISKNICLPKGINYIIHGASPTESRFFISNPVETIKAGVIGTINLLDYAVEMGIRGFIYLSSMEVYGQIDNEEILDENNLGYVNPLITRDCYPETKRMSEAVVASYAKEYGIKATSIRLAQTFGPGVSYIDQRVFAMMARCVLNKEDIVLQTKGESKHPYLYTAQAVSAILCVLLKGNPGRSYNACNPDTYCSILEMGDLVSKELANSTISVKFSSEKGLSKYPPTSYLNLDITAIQELGWRPKGDLVFMYKRMIQSI